MSHNQDFNIRIHELGSRTTDAEKVEKLSVLAQTGFRKAQDVLVAADKYINKKGFFSSERSRTQKLQSSLYELSHALRNDGFMADDPKSQDKIYVLYEFFSQFSDAFPNWQKEYATLNKFIPLCF